MRETFKALFKNNKIIRTGELVRFKGIIGGHNKNTNALIINVRLLDDRFPEYVLEDHVWLTTFDYHGANLKELLSCKLNKGREVIFTAKVMPYRDCSNYGLRLTNDSELYVI